MIKYLVKFVSKEEYADDLLNGMLFMHSAQYYHKLELENGPGQGDLREGTITPYARIYKNICCPVYCMYTVKEDDIENSTILFDEQVIKDFGCQTGYLVIIPYESFKSNIDVKDSFGFAKEYGEINYRHLSFDDMIEIINNNRAINLFVKVPFFSYQNEFRLVIYTSIASEESYIYQLKYSFASTAKKVAIQSLTHQNNGYILELSPLFKR